MDRRHIQNASEAAYQIYHWGYASRSFPCTNDAGSCEYLDAVYWMHDISMLYTFIMWAAIAGVLFVWVMFRSMRPQQIRPVSDTEGLRMSDTVENAFYRGTRAAAATFRRFLLPEFATRYLGNVTRLQVLILVVLSSYLLIFSLVGIVYKTWITPVKNTDLFNTRTGLGGFADRVGALAYALTPLTVALGTRESILTLLTGVSYQHFNFLHRWCGRIIFVQSFLHTLGWVLIEARFYQPQPKVWTEFISQEYMIYGCAALGLITLMFILSLRRVIDYTGHEFFRKTHYIIAAIYIGTCWGHWKQLNCWMIASLVVMFLDRIIRLIRVAFIHIGFAGPNGGFGFKTAQATMECHEDDGGFVVRLDFDHPHDPWRPGQHFFLTFPALSVWQSHPFTVASSPNPKSVSQHHTYIIRSRNGETSKLAALARKVSAEKTTTPVILMGPYGADVLCEAPNVLAVAGGTGISFVMPLAAEVLSRSWNDFNALKLIWAVRQARDVDWMMPELRTLKATAAAGGTALDITIFVTRESKIEAVPDEKFLGEITTISGSSSQISSQSSLAVADFNIVYLGDSHPDLQAVVREALNEVEFAEGAVQVLASGPAGMGRDLRSAVAARNDGVKVWRGNSGHDVSLHWDDRMY